MHPYALPARQPVNTPGPARPPTRAPAELHICEPPSGRVTDERKLAAIRRMLSVSEEQGAALWALRVHPPPS